MHAQNKKVPLTFLQKKMKMKKIALIVVLIVVIPIYSQSNKKESWSIGFGLSNHTMAGDHRSIGTGLSDGADDNNIINLGGYIYIDKMFNPAFGLEFKVHYTTMSGAAQEITSNYEVLFADRDLSQTKFDGTAYGFELNTIINFSNLAPKPYRTEPRKWNLAGYVGIGLQHYNSKLYDKNTNQVFVRLW